MSKDFLRTGDKALIHFRFIKYPEYMIPGQRMVFREGRTKAVGNVVRIITTSNSIPANSRVKPSKQHQRYVQSQNGPQNQQTQQNKEQQQQQSSLLQQVTIYKYKNNKTFKILSQTLSIFIATVFGSCRSR